MDRINELVERAAKAEARMEAVRGLEQVEVAQRVKVDGLLLHSGTRKYVKADDLRAIIDGGAPIPDPGEEESSNGSPPVNNDPSPDSEGFDGR